MVDRNGNVLRINEESKRRLYLRVGLRNYIVSFGEKCKFLSELEWAGKWRLFEMGGSENIILMKFSKF